MSDDKFRELGLAIPDAEQRPAAPKDIRAAFKELGLAEPDSPVPTWSDYGNVALKGATKATQGAAGMIADRLGIKNTLQEDAAQTVQRIENKITPEGRAVAENPIYDWDKKEFGPTPVRSTLMSIAASAPQMIQGMAVGGPFSGALTRAGIGEGVAAAALPVGTPGIISRFAASRINNAPNILAEGVSAGISGAQDVGEAIRKTPDEVALKNPTFRGIFDSVDPALPQAERMRQAKELAARQAENEVFGRSTATTAGVGAVLGSGIEGQLIRNFLRRGATDAAKDGYIKSTLKGAAGESITEGPQSGLEQYNQNVAEARYGDQSIDPTRNVGTAAVSGAIVGAAMGAGGGAAGRLIEGGERPANAPGATPPNPQIAPGATPPAPPAAPTAPAAPSGPITAAVQAGQQSGAIPTDAAGAAVDYSPQKQQALTQIREIANQLDPSSDLNGSPAMRKIGALALDARKYGATDDEVAGALSRITGAAPAQAPAPGPISEAARGAAPAEAPQGYQGVDAFKAAKAMVALKNERDTGVPATDPLAARHRDAFARGEIQSSRDLMAAEQRMAAPSSPQPAAPAAGEWVPFPAESGSLGVPRAEMPQVSADRRGALVNFLKGRGITAATEEAVPAETLKPTQAEFSPEKVQQAADFKGGERGILASSDGYIVDGHHQWLAKATAGQPVKVTRLDAPINTLLDAVRQFPSAERAEGATAAAPVSDETPAAPAAEQPGLTRMQAARTEASEAAATAAPATATAVTPAAESAAPAAPATSMGKRPGLSQMQREQADAADKAIYADAAAKFNALLDEANAAKAAGNTAEYRRIQTEMRPLDLAMRGAQGRVNKREMNALSQAHQASAQTKYSEMAVGATLRPSEFPEAKGIYWEKTAPNEWTARGEWFQNGRTRTDAELAESGGLVKMEAPAKAPTESKPGLAAMQLAREDARANEPGAKAAPTPNREAAMEEARQIAAERNRLDIALDAAEEAGDTAAAEQATRAIDEHAARTQARMDELAAEYGSDAMAQAVMQGNDRATTEAAVEPPPATKTNDQPGATDAEVAEIAQQFDAAAENALDSEDQVTHVFDAPAKQEVVRLSDRVKVAVGDSGWMTPAEARARIAEWKENAAKQGKTQANADKVVLSLFDLTGAWSQPWADAGYQVFRFDIQADPQAGDVNNFSTEFFNDWFGSFDGMDIYAVLAACPCTDFASSGARHFAAKDADGRTVSSVALVKQTLATIEYFKPPVWAIENPVGRIEKLTGLPPWRLSFDPNHFGDPYTKKTLLWGRFNGELPVAPVKPTEGSKMWSQYGGSSLRTKNARSATPEGFAYSFFQANNAIDNPVMAVSNKYDRLDRSAVKAALDAGLTPADIDFLVEDLYYQDLDDAGANAALREAATAASTQTEAPAAPTAEDKPGLQKMRKAKAAKPEEAAADKPGLTKMRKAKKATSAASETPVAPPAAETPVEAPVAEAGHIEGGKIEEASPEVVRESVEKSADRTPLNLKEAKAFLLGAVDKAIAAAPTEKSLGVVQSFSKEKGSYISLVGESESVGSPFAGEDEVRQQYAAWLAKTIGYVTFDVPGDGSFRVLNTVESLQRFRAKVNTSAGFRDAPTKRPAPPTVGTSTSTSIREMLDDQEFRAAHELARITGTPLGYGRGNGDATPIYTDISDVEIAKGVEAFVGKTWPTPKGGNSWKVIEKSTGMSVGEGSSQNAAIALAKERGGDKGLKIIEAVKRAKAQNPEWELGQAALEKKWLAAIPAEPEIDEATAPAPAPTPAPVAEKPAEPKPPKGVQDFGEKLEGARKYRQPSLDKTLTDADIRSQSLSAIWPLAEIAAIEDKFTAAVATAARAEIPTKPQKGYKLDRWVEKVKTVRSLASMLMDGTVTRDTLEQRLKGFPRLDGFAAKVRLLDSIDRAQWSRIGAVSEYPEAYTFEDGKRVSTPLINVEIDGRNKQFAARTVEQALDQVNAALATVTKTKMAFEVRGSKDRYFINKKGDAEYRPLKVFTSGTEALNYLRDNYAELVKAWEETKERDNVKKTDVRREQNRDRAGADYRKGKDVTAESFGTTFGFRGVEFGNWVGQGTGDKERQGLLNQAYDALMDLADIIGVPPRAISLNGTLGLGFGSRGSGWASAHFEPNTLVINLTKTRGAGSLAHEWFHAADNYFARMRRDGQEVRFTGDQVAYRNANFITQRPEAYYEKQGRVIPARDFEAAVAAGPVRSFPSSADADQRKIYQTWRMIGASTDGWTKLDAVRPEVEERFAELVKALRESPMKARADRLGKGADNYWSRTIELGARAFENYVISKMAQKGYVNDYLANVVTPEEFPRSAERYPYLRPEEEAPIVEAFDALFGTMQTRETDQGVALFMRGDDALARQLPVVRGTLEQVEPQAAREQASALWKQWAESGGIQSDSLGANVVFSRRGQSKLIGNSTVTPERLAAIRSLPELLQSAVVYDRLPHRTNPQAEAMLYAVAPLRLGGELYSVKLNLTQLRQDADLRLYELAGWEMEPAAITGGIGSGDRQTGPGPAGSTVSVAQLVSAVKGKPALLQGTSPAGQARTAVERAVQRITAQWRNAPDIVILDRPSEAPFDAPADARGAYWNGSVYLFSANLPTDAWVQEALFHESHGHYGLRRMLGRDYLPTMFQIAARNANIAARAARWRAANPQPKSMDAGVHEAISIEEALAETAQKGERISGLQRVVKRLIDALRKHKFDRVANWLEGATNAEVMTLLAQSRQFVEEGGRSVYTASAPVYSRAVNGDQPQEGAPSASDGEGPEVPLMMRSPQQTHRAISQGVQEALANLTDNQPTFNLWHRTVGTQYHKAKLDADYGRVFYSAQGFTNDTSLYSVEAAELAPDIVPMIGSVRAAVSQLASVVTNEMGPAAKRILQIDRDARSRDQRDLDAAAKVLFRATLLDKKVFTPAELARKGLTPRQQEIYFQARAAVDQSIDTLGVSTLAHVVRNVPELAAVRAEVKATDMAFDAAHMAFSNGLQDAVAEMEMQKAVALDRFRNGNATEKDQASAQLAKLNSQQNRYLAFKDDLDGILDRLTKLKDEGYMPLMRFGDWAVDVRDAKGETVHFEMRQGRIAANRAAREMEQFFAGEGYTVTVSPMDKNRWKLFQGVTPEVVELFGKAAGLEGDQVYQDWLRLAVADNSALKRLIQRKGTPGFVQDDLSRVVASFVTSNARLASKNWHYGDMLQAVVDIPRTKGDVAAEAGELVRYVQNPTEEAAKLRSLLFVYFIGGSLASAYVNMLQPLQQTLPELSKTVGVTKAMSLLMGSLKDLAVPPGGALGQALRLAEDKGIVAPHEIHQLYAEAINNLGGGRGMRAAMTLWGSFFAIAEQFNRRVSFMAAYRAAEGMTPQQRAEHGIISPYDYAVDMVDATQGIYNRANRPNLARGAIGATVLTFKQFSIAFIEQMVRMTWKGPNGKRNLGALGLTLGMLVLLAGVEGLPGAEDWEDIIDTIGQAMGYNTNSKAWISKALRNTLGETAGEFATRGFSTLVPLDVSGRLSMGNLIPGTGMFKQDAQTAQQMTELIGPVGGVVRQVMSAWGSLNTAGPAKAAQEIAPKAIRDLTQAVDMWSTGAYRDARGYKVLTTDRTDAMLKAIGFQPQNVATAQREIREDAQTIAVARRQETAIADRWARAIIDKDPEGAAKARQSLIEWNAKNPSTPIRITPEQIRKRVMEAQMTKEQRQLRSTPRELRPYVMER